MLPEKIRLKTIVIVITALLIPILPFTMYRMYVYQIKVTRAQLLLTSLKGRVQDMDEALASTARAYIFTQDSVWYTRYQLLQEKFSTSIFQIDSLSKQTFNHSELIVFHDQLKNMDERIFSLAKSGQVPAAKAILNGAAYRQQQALFSSGMNQLTAWLDKDADKLFQVLQYAAVKNMMLRALVGIILLGAWIGFTRMNRKWKVRVNQLKEQRTREAILTAKELEHLNEQLRQLSKHLEEVREQERLSLAHEINEQIGQQIAMMKIRMAAICESTTGSQTEAGLMEISAHIDKVLHDRRKLATEVYPLVLRDLGLVEALQWESEQVSIGSGVAVRFSAAMEEVALDPKNAAALFQSYREKLQTAIADGATQVVSQLWLEGESILLQMKHDSKEAEDPSAVLIKDMAIQERLRNRRGYWQTVSALDEGSSFIMSIPIHAN